MNKKREIHGIDFQTCHVVVVLADMLSKCKSFKYPFNGLNISVVDRDPVNTHVKIEPVDWPDSYCIHLRLSSRGYRMPFEGTLVVPYRQFHFKVITRGQGLTLRFPREGEEYSLEEAVLEWEKEEYPMRRLQLWVFRSDETYYSSYGYEDDLKKSLPDPLFTIDIEIDASNLEAAQNSAKEEARKRNIPHVVNLD